MAVNPLELRRRIILAQPHLETSSGAMITIGGVVNAPVKKCKSAITAVQSGTGDPSPSNIRPITGWTGVNITVSSTTNAADGTVYSVVFPAGVGTVYGGTVDLLSGTLIVTWTGFNPLDLTNLRIDSVNDGIVCFCSYNLAGGGAKKINRNTLISNMFILEDVNASGYMWGTTNQIYLKLASSVIGGTSLDDGKAWMAEHPVILCAELETAETYSLTPQTVRTLAGTNNIWSNTGNIELSYWTH